MISIEKKKKFIKYLLNNYYMKCRESVWILNYLMSNDELMKKVHFVEDVKYCPRGITMSTKCSDEVAFSFYLEDIMVTDFEKAFHYIRMNREKDFYLEINFNDKFLSDEYLDVLENNPYYKNKTSINPGINIFLNNILSKNKAKVLMLLINKSLDNKDKNAFMKLSKEYKELFNNAIKTK